MICKHYYYFGKRIQNRLKGGFLDKEDWDALRTDEQEGPFSIEKSADAWEQNCKKQTEYEDTARIIKEELSSRNVQRIVSLGVGKGILEYHLKRMLPFIRIECTDYTPNAIEDLRKVFLSMDESYVFDMLNSDYETISDAIVLMYRVSTGFDAYQWQLIFEKMYSSRINNIIYVPTELLSRRDAKNARLNHIKNIIRLRKPIFCGWMYSEDEFLKFFSGSGNNTFSLYNVEKRIPFRNTAIYFLRRNVRD